MTRRGSGGVNTWLRRWASGVCLMLLGSAVGADDTAVLDRFFEEVTSLHAAFEQVTYDERNQLVEKARGEFEMLRPDRFSWRYEMPYEQRIVADGERLWVYDVDLEQVSVQSLDEALGRTPARLLTGDGDPQESFAVEPLGQSDGLIWFRLVPHGAETGFDVVYLGFDEQVPRRMELEDSFGHTTQLRFSAIKVNPDLGPERFEFEIPEGIDVIGDAPARGSAR